MFKLPFGSHFPFAVRREAVTLTLLSGLGIVLIIGVTALSELYQGQQEALSNRWFARGTNDLNAEKFRAAADDFHSALRYSHDDFDQELGLAEALIGMKHLDEAEFYLKTLWEEQPENGMVNLQLARIAAGRGDTGQALRYYHNAIYAIWSSDADAERRSTRWELIKYLLHLGARTLAQSELISLAADLGDDTAQQIDLGEYFLKVQDYPHALSAFRLYLEANPRNPEALAGAGAAAFGLEDYRTAAAYLDRAFAQNPSNHETAEQLDTARKVLRLDPFHGQNSEVQRNRTVIEDFQAAGDRLTTCPAIANNAPAQSNPQAGSNQQKLSQAWAQLKPQVTEHGLRRSPDTLNRVMDLVFDIEHQANATCGPGNTTDQALLLISKFHERS